MLQKVKVLSLSVLLAFSACRSAERFDTATENPAEIQVLATIHKYHLTNPNYPYGKVTQLIQQFNPDIIGIEIRPEDLKEDSAYLAQFYPLEMRQVLKDFPIAKIRGLDWYGKQMAGKKMPADVFINESTELGKIKKLEREMNRDSILAPKLLSLADLGRQQVELAETASPAILNNGQYDGITLAFYQALEATVKGTPYETYANFNRHRDEHITRNIMELVTKNPGKKIIVVVGANHRGRAVRTLENMAPGSIKLIPVKD